MPDDLIASVPHAPPLISENSAATNMPVLNHHIVSATDSETSARFYSEVLGLGSAKKLGHFAVLPVSADTTLDFVDSDTGLDRQH